MQSLTIISDFIAVLWSTKADVLTILSDPCSYVMAVFVKSSEEKVHRTLNKILSIDYKAF